MCLTSEMRCVLSLFLQVIVQKEISIHWSLKTKWVRLKFCASASKSRLFYPKGLYLTIIFLLLCSHGCASIWEVAWTLHGHYEEEYNALWGAAGGNVWLKHGPVGSRELGTGYLSAFLVQDTKKPPISNTTHKENGHYGTVNAAVFLGILETISKSRHRWIAHSLPPLCCWYFIIRPRLKMVLTLSSLTWFRMASVQQFKCLMQHPKCARYRSLLPSGVPVGINFQIKFCGRRLPVPQRQPVEYKPLIGLLSF